MSTQKETTQNVRNEVPGFLVLPVTFLEVSLNGSCVHIKALCCHSINVSVLAQHFLLSNFNNEDKHSEEDAPLEDDQINVNEEQQFKELFRAVSSGNVGAVQALKQIGLNVDWFSNDEDSRCRPSR